MSPSDFPWSEFPLTGTLVSLARPFPPEYDAITELRNRESIRRWFFDSRELDVERNRVWLAEKQSRCDSQVLVIRFNDGSFLGFIGWSHFDGVGGSIQLGGVALQPDRYRAIARRLGYVPRIADQAGQLLIDFAFRTLRVSRVTAEVMRTNRRSAALCDRAGLSVVGTVEHCDEAGRAIEATIFRLTRDEWLASHDRIRHNPNASEAKSSRALK